MNILILGLGQSLRGDDGAGLEAVRLWQKNYPQTAQNVQMELCDLPGLDLLDLLEGMDVAILVDTVHSGDTPGTSYRLTLKELAAFNTEAQSSHGWGVAETLALGQSLHPELEQCRIILIGIAGSQFGMGAGLSPAVQAALPETIALIEKEVQELLV